MGVFERIRSITAEQLGADEAKITLQTSFVEDLNADSLDLVELIMSLEEEFSKEGKAIEVSDAEAEKIVTVQHAVNWIQEHGIEE